ncbi:hypothetical protein ABH945_004408 [Paraburkholderia sp. GAS333]
MGWRRSNGATERRPGRSGEQAQFNLKKSGMEKWRGLRSTRSDAAKVKPKRWRSAPSGHVNLPESEATPGGKKGAVNGSALWPGLESQMSGQTALHAPHGCHPVARA